MPQKSFTCMSSNLKTHRVRALDIGTGTGKLTVANIHGCNMAATKEACWKKMNCNGFRRSVESQENVTNNDEIDDQGYIRKTHPDPDFDDDAPRYIVNSGYWHSTGNGKSPPASQTSIIHCSVLPSHLNGYKRLSDEDLATDCPEEETSSVRGVTVAQTMITAPTVTIVECSAVVITTCVGSDATLSGKKSEIPDTKGNPVEATVITIPEVKIINREPGTEAQLDTTSSSDTTAALSCSKLETYADQQNIFDNGGEGANDRGCRTAVDAQLSGDSDNNEDPQATESDKMTSKRDVYSITSRESKDTENGDSSLNNLNRKNSSAENDMLNEDTQDGEGDPGAHLLTIKISTMAIQVDTLRDEEGDQKGDAPQEGTSEKNTELDRSKRTESLDKNFSAEEELEKKRNKDNKFLKTRGRRPLPHGPEKGYTPDMVRYQPYNGQSQNRQNITSSQPPQTGIVSMPPPHLSNFHYLPPDLPGSVHQANVQEDIPELDLEEVTRQLFQLNEGMSPAQSPILQEASLPDMMLPISSAASFEGPTNLHSSSTAFMPNVPFQNLQPISTITSSTTMTDFTPPHPCTFAMTNPGYMNVTTVSLAPQTTYLPSYLKPEQQQPRQRTTMSGNSVGTVTEHPQPSTIRPILLPEHTILSPSTIQQQQNSLCEMAQLSPDSQPGGSVSSQPPKSPCDMAQPSPYSETGGSVCGSPSSASAESPQGSPYSDISSPAPSTPSPYTSTQPRHTGTPHSDGGYWTSSPDPTSLQDGVNTAPQQQWSIPFPNPSMETSDLMQQPAHQPYRHQRLYSTQQQNLKAIHIKPNEIIVNGKRFVEVPQPVEQQPQHMPVVQNNNFWAGEIWNKVQNAPLDKVCAKDEDGDTSLHIAIAQGEESLSKALTYRLSKDSRADLDAQDNHGQTPLHIAVLTDSPVIIYDLIISGANVNKCNHEGKSVLHCAAERGYSQAIYTIGEAITKFNNGLQPPAERISLVVDVKDSEGLTPLHVAVNTHGTWKRVFRGDQTSDITVDNRETIRSLCRMRASPAYQDGKAGKTSLHYAAEKGLCEIMELLLSLVQEPSKLVNTPMFNGNTALHLVVGSNREEEEILNLVTILFRNGADPGIQNSEGEKAITYAKQGHNKVKRKLKKGQ